MPHLTLIYLIVSWFLLSLAPSSAVTLSALSSSILEIEEEEESSSAEDKSVFAQDKGVFAQGNGSLAQDQSTSASQEQDASDKNRAPALITVKHLKDMPNLAEADARAAALSAAYDKAMEQKSARDSAQAQHEFLRSLELKHDESLLDHDDILPDSPSSQAKQDPNFEFVTTVRASEMNRAALHQATRQESTPSRVSSPYIYGQTRELSVKTIALALDMLKLEPVAKLDLRLGFMSNDTLFVLNAEDLQRATVDCLQGRAYDCYLAGRHYDAMVSHEFKERLKERSQASTNDNALVTISEPSPQAVLNAAYELSAFKEELQEQSAPSSPEPKLHSEPKLHPEPSLEANTNPELSSEANLSTKVDLASEGEVKPETKTPEALVRGTGHDVASELPPVANNIIHMLSFYRRGCLESSQESCTMMANANGRVGVALILGLFELKYPEIAVQYLDRGCKRGDPSSCANLGLVQYNGMLGTQVPLETSLTKLRDSCQLALTASRLVRDYDNNVSLGCLTLGTIALHGVYKDGVTRAPDVHEARRELNFACNLYNMEGCALLHKLDDSLERAVIINAQR